MPLCPGLYPGGTSVCTCPLLCDQWARAVVTGPVWQIDHDESQGWKPASVTAGPGQVQDDAGSGKTESTVDSPGLAPPSRASKHFLPLSFYQQIRSLIKGQGEKKGRERGQRSEKGERDWHVCGRESGERATSRPLSDGGGSCSGWGTCVPAASQGSAKLRLSNRQCQTHERLPWKHP